MLKYFYLFFVFFCIHFVEAREIRFPDEELAPESVLPVFENRKNVTMNRRVQLKNKLGLRGSFLGRMDEPFFHPLTFVGGFEFFFNETHGLRFSSVYFWPGLSRIGLRVAEVPVATESESDNSINTTFTPGKIHHPQYGFFLSYALSPIYGKISLATNLVTNLNLSMYVGLGALSLNLDTTNFQSDEKWTYAGWVEFNQKIFIGRRFYFHGSLNFLIYHAPNPVWCSLPTPNSDIPEDSCNFYVNRRNRISYEKAEKDILFRTIVGGGLGILLF